MTDKLREAAQQAEREAFEAWASETSGFCSHEVELCWAAWQARSALAQQDAQAGGLDISELYAQGWLNGNQVQSLIDWCNSGCAKRADVAFAGGSTRQMAYAIEHLVKRVSSSETSDGVFVPRELLAKVANALGLPYEEEHTRLRGKLLDILSFAAPAQRVTLTDEEIGEAALSAGCDPDYDDGALVVRVARAVIEAYERKNGVKP